MKIPESITAILENMSVNSHFWVDDLEVNNWVNQTKFFFVLAIGRSGTASLAGLLNKAIGAAVAHEPVTLDYRAHQTAFASPQAALEYMDRFRKKEIYLRMRHKKISSYGEVNSLLRRHAQALPQTFPRVVIIHLIRDGRDVVRSMMNRNTFTQSDRHTRHIMPLNNDPWKNQWHTMDRFARLCWYWQVENAYLRQNVERRVNFEQLISDYHYFDQNLLQPLGLELEESVWAAHMNTPQNISKSYLMPKWTEWSIEQQKTFMDICGEEMKLNGYHSYLDI